MKIFFLILTVISSLTSYCQNDFTINKMYNQLNEKTFKFNPDVYDVKNSNVINKKGDIRLIKLLEFDDIIVSYPFFKKSLTTFSINDVKAGGVYLILHLKNLDKNIILSFSRGFSIKKRCKKEFELSFNLKIDYSEFDYIFLDSNYNPDFLVNIFTRAENAPKLKEGITKYVIYGCEESEKIKYTTENVFTVENFSSIVKEIYLKEKVLSHVNCISKELQIAIPNWVKTSKYPR